MARRRHRVQVIACLCVFLVLGLYLEHPKSAVLTGFSEIGACCAAGDYRLCLLEGSARPRVAFIASNKADGKA